MATGNHFWLDIAAGVAIAAVAYVVARLRGPNRLRVSHDASQPIADADSASVAIRRRARGAQRRYTTGVRRRGRARHVGARATRITPNALTAAGVTLCIAAAVLVYFEYQG